MSCKKAKKKRKIPLKYMFDTRHFAKCFAREKKKTSVLVLFIDESIEAYLSTFSGIIFESIIFEVAKNKKLKSFCVKSVCLGQ